MIIDGKQIASEVIADLGDSLLGCTLGVVMNSGNPASRSFVAIKERVASRLGVVLQQFTAEQFNDALECDGVIVQLPIENGDALMARIPPQKDIDALGPNPLVVPPVAAAVKEILTRAPGGIAHVRGGLAVVVGEGKLVGKPVAAMLRNLGAEVRVVSLEHGSLTDIKEADIVVSGAGVPGLIQPHMLKQGVALIDAGTSEQGGKLGGDCDPSCAEVASVFTPVPGGVGPIAVAMLFKNLSELTKLKN